jgi:hypothetical protein
LLPSARCIYAVYAVAACWRASFRRFWKFRFSSQQLRQMAIAAATSRLPIEAGMVSRWSRIDDTSATMSWLRLSSPRWVFTLSLNKYHCFSRHLRRHAEHRVPPRKPVNAVFLFFRVTNNVYVRCYVVITLFHTVMAHYRTSRPTPY